MEMIERYIYAVTQKLPQSQRADIAKELRSLIQDMLDERVVDREANDQDVEEVLLDLGSPKQLAQRYRGVNKYLIGPEFYDSYISLLKIVSLSIVVAMGVIFAIQFIFDPTGFFDYLGGFIASLVTVIPQGFAWVTVGFICIEYFGGVKAEDIKLGKEWRPSEIPPIPETKRQIKRSEPIVSIIFYVIVIMMFLFSNRFFGIFVFEVDQDGRFSTVVPFLNEATFSNYLPFIILVLGLSIFKEALKLISGKWTFNLVLYSTFINAITFVVVSIMIMSQSFWNPDFMFDLVQAGVITEDNEAYGTISKIWDTATLVILATFIIGLIWDSVNGFIKVRKQ
ncbi:HAAS signaling domain-containing protein [Virgibacillus litoralis]|uniref:ABC transporter permease n=1 Tax=Virgibacillus litoralis TaxID=578221 RepID=A0ABS4HHU8_9BACI|nr:hypothetical protein [Virgibacillus litoralis]MBP1950174.1 hypothetical protein [Virgibacillus litoralis]